MTLMNEYVLCTNVSKNLSTRLWISSTKNVTRWTILNVVASFQNMLTLLTKRLNLSLWIFIRSFDLYTMIWTQNFNVTLRNQSNILIWMFFYKKTKKTKKYDETWNLNIVVVMNLIINLVDLRIIFALLSNKIRTIIITIVLLMKVFRKKTMTMISTMLMHLSIINNNRRVKRNILSFISTTILLIKIVFIKISQTIVKIRRRRLKQINHT